MELQQLRQTQSILFDDTAPHRERQRIYEAMLKDCGNGVFETQAALVRCTNPPSQIFLTVCNQLIYIMATQHFASDLLVAHSGAFPGDEDMLDDELATLLLRLDDEFETGDVLTNQ
jgi:hypothetical protein